MREKTLVLVLSAAWLAVSFANGEVLTPPYFNLADGRKITATATCGEGTPEPELYCKLVGANADRDVNINLIQGQVRFFCLFQVRVNVRRLKITTLYCQFQKLLFLFFFCII